MMTRADALVLFGATGDLARKKLFSALYQLEAQDRLNLPVIGVALSDWDDEQFRDHARSAIEATVKGADPVVVQRLCQRLTLVGGDYGREQTFQSLASRLRALGSRHGVFYLAIPPSMFPTVVQGLASVGLTNTARLVVEKPFGRDLASASISSRGDGPGCRSSSGPGRAWRPRHWRRSSSCGRRRGCCSPTRACRARTRTSCGSGSDTRTGSRSPCRLNARGQELATEPVDLQVDFGDALGPRQEAYERLLDDALDGNPRRFAREDGVESAWRVVQPALDDLGQVHPYQRGTWGPVEADELLQGGHWHAPQAASPQHVSDQHTHT